MLVCIDLSRLYLVLRKVRFSLDYSKFISFLRDLNKNGTVEIVGFTVADENNPRQTAFLKRLEGMGVKLHVYPFETRPNFTTEIAATAGLSAHEDVVVVSDDVSLISVFNILQERNRNCGLAFFSTELSGQWIPHFLQGNFSLFDLGTADTKSQIAAPRGKPKGKANKER